MTTNKAWLGLIGAALVFAACDSSKDSLLSTGGRGGNSNGGAAGTASGGKGGAGGAPSCAQATCLRPYTCITECGGPIISNNCCACVAPAFDNFQNMACGGSGGGGAGGGAAGAAGGAAGAAGGAPGGNGGAGSSGSAGRGGSGGGAAGAAGSGAGGRGGSSGAAGTASGGTGGNVDAGTDAFDCAHASCARPYLCVNACGGPVISNNCCACQAPAFDDFMGMACGDAGASAISYVGCRIIGGLNRTVISKRDTSRDLCVTVGLVAPRTPPAGLTLPASYGLEYASAGPAATCPTRGAGTQGGPVTGTVEAVGSTTTEPMVVNVDLTVTLPGNDEAIITRDLDVTPFCP